MSEKPTRRSGEGKSKTDHHIKMNEIGPLDLNLPVGSIDLQSQSLDRVSVDLSVNFKAASEDAKKIIKEAAILAEQKKIQT